MRSRIRRRSLSYACVHTRTSCLAGKDFDRHHGWQSQRFYTCRTCFGEVETSKSSRHLGIVDWPDHSVGECCSASLDAKQRSSAHSGAVSKRQLDAVGWDPSGERRNLISTCGKHPRTKYLVHGLPISEPNVACADLHSCTSHCRPDGCCRHSGRGATPPSPPQVVNRNSDATACGDLHSCASHCHPDGCCRHRGRGVTPPAAPPSGSTATVAVSDSFTNFCTINTKPHNTGSIYC